MELAVLQCTLRDLEKAYYEAINQKEAAAGDA